MTYLFGLTGGIGSGKSTVADLFQKQGVAVIDSDATSHQLTQSGGAAIAAIRQSFGDDYIDASGALNRTRMRQLVFPDPAAKLKLEAILHPLIRTEILHQVSNAISAAVTPPVYILLVIPLLFESSGFLDMVQRTLVVDCEEATQVERAMQRKGLDEQTVRAIMATQISRTERLHRADQIIHNDNDLDSLQQQVAHLHQQYLAALSAGND